MNNGCRRALEVWKSCRSRRNASREPRPVTYAAIVRAYQRDYQEGARAELEFYANLATIEEAVARAANAERPDGKRHDHQTRIRPESLKEVAQRLKGVSWDEFKKFSDLHAYLDQRIGVVPGIGELMVYDTALRIGAKLGLEPEVVYLHRGTRSGAKALGLDTKRPFVLVGKLPHEFSALRPHEIEDCLCIYKAELSARAAG